MSRFLAAFRQTQSAPDEKTRFPASPVPNKSKKANNLISGGETGGIHNLRQGYSPFSTYSEPYPRENTFFEGADIDPAEAVYLATERAAIIAESALDRATPQWVLDIQTAEAVQPCFTPGQMAEPEPGAPCRCCKSRSFWNEAIQPKGWRCSICHPPLGLAAGAVREVRT